MTHGLSPVETAASLGCWRSYIEDQMRSAVDVIPAEVEKNPHRSAVFLELRRTPFSEFVIRQFLNRLGPDWGLCLCVGPDMVDWATALSREWGAVRVVALQPDRTETSQQYLNRTLRTTAFWHALPSEQLLLFDSDSLLRKTIPPEVLHYDFIGPPWAADAVSPWCRVGGGKVSIRTRSAMIDAIERCNARPHLIQDEDVFFSVVMHLSRDRYRIADPEVAGRFCVSQTMNHDPVALHRAWQYIEKDHLAHLLGT